MKKLVLLASCGILFSCSKNESKDFQTSIVGRWQVEKSTYIESRYISGTEISKDTTVFLKDGSYVEFLQSNKVVAYDHDHDYYDTGSYTISGNTLMLDDIKATITEHTNSSLKFNYRAEDNYNDNSSQVTIGFIELSK